MNSRLQKSPPSAVADRLARRRRLLAWTALPVAAALVAGSALVHRSFTTWRGTSALATLDDPAAEESAAEESAAEESAAGEPAGDPSAAGDWFSRSATFAVTDRQWPPFNEGVAALAGGDLGAARRSFTTAFELADDDSRCVVLVNLALTVELQGLVAERSDEDAAQAFWVEAAELVTASPGCLQRTTADGEGEGDRLQRLLARLAERLDGGGRQLDDSLVANREAQTRPPDDPITELDRRLDQNAEVRTRGRELEEDVQLERSGSDGPRW